MKTIASPVKVKQIFVLVVAYQILNILQIQELKQKQENVLAREMDTIYLLKGNVLNVLLGVKNVQVLRVAMNVFMALSLLLMDSVERRFIGILLMSAKVMIIRLSGRVRVNLASVVMMSVELVVGKLITACIVILRISWSL